GDRVFQAGQAYEVIEEVGEMKDGGFGVLKNIGVSEEGGGVFEKRFKKRGGKVEKEGGFEGIGVVRGVESERYVIVRLWERERGFEEWEEWGCY
ncbi:antibiotic biosynthesis monooxygenase family protein, partial [Bacillus subtilis]|uniref:antibiotic biosynthesis monooxygenase family protein n=1 Tax=Bacillus subtilis TaxID=1423 RepID=UPI003F4D0152